jgi:hypothetical protein
MIRVGFRCLGLMAFGALVGSSAFADNSTDRAKIYGSWQAGGEGGAAKTVWILEDRGDAFHIVNSLGDKKLADFACVLGQECEVKDGGRKVKVTLYFNGAKLVELEVKGEEVVKRRFGTGETGDGLDLEVIPVTPSGKTETVHFKRLDGVESKLR